MWKKHLTKYKNFHNKNSQARHRGDLPQRDKVLYEKYIANIIFNGERQKAFPLQSETRFHTVMEILAGTSRQEKEKTSGKNGRAKTICLQIS